jgi:chemotaxis regulatin CheY-phosphate phosphatase CheZ
MVGGYFLYLFSLNFCTELYEFNVFEPAIKPIDANVLEIYFIQDYISLLSQVIKVLIDLID